MMEKTVTLKLTAEDLGFLHEGLYHYKYYMETSKPKHEWEADMPEFMDVFKKIDRALLEVDT